MATTITLRYPTGSTDIYAYYVGRTLANYVADKVLFVEGTGPDTGLYTATVDETKGTQIVAFVGATQPGSWAEAIAGVSWEIVSAGIPTDIDGYTFTEAQRLMLAAMVGPITGGGTGTNVIKGADESKARITGTYDNLGNRTVTDLDAT
jgi:uncharacterized protein (DUF2126 family)